MIAREIGCNILPRSAIAAPLIAGPECGPFFTGKSTNIEQRGATLKPLPPYSHDFNPIEPAWGLVKKHIRDNAPRTGPALRRVARTARHVITPYHCRQFFAHAGYGNSSGN